MRTLLSSRNLSIIGSIALAGMSFTASATVISQIGLNPQNSSVSNQLQVTAIVWLNNPHQATFSAKSSPYITQMGHVLVPTTGGTIDQNANPATWGASLNGLACDTATYKSTMPTPTTAFGGDSSFTPWITFHVAGTGSNARVDKCWLANAAK